MSATGAFTQAGGWFRARTGRERALIVLAAALVLGYVVIIVVWRPMMEIRRDAASEIARLDRAIAAVRAVEPGAAPGAGAAETPDPGLPPSTAVTRGAATLGLSIRRLEPDGDRLRVSLDEASVDAVLAWLALLERDHGLRVGAIQLDRRPAPGLVTTEVTLTQ